ncbi:secretory carrier-associated membrane protein 2 [Callorhinchus milii]|uniref:Secretory carrier-associated membrane protein n=1 Tax=Callorhinchus milii TaxID=7868 RepID=V9KBY2_CALMI|nr:secretory carrier-associated membrane protein 2 [Callorhinchus milii]|eukprot:gi/632938778/ref/XP_007906355.1/ PREDICTED: secretory carrier-associated membrane protein 2 [Callorhinchus milii]
MSGFEANPFADPVDINPFQDPSVTQLTQGNKEGIEDFNPFSENTRLTPTLGTTVPAAQKTPSQPAILQPTVEPSPQATASAAQLALLRQQEELEKKAAELDRKEQELNENYNPKRNNWPPFPAFCPIKPCFYQDFSGEIPAGLQTVVKMLYYLWMFHSFTLFLNLLACLAEFIVKPEYGVDFGLAILWFLLFTPCAFICWYRPIYKAFRSDSSFNFFFFFFVFFCQIILYIIQTVGIPKWGVSGWIAALSWISSNIAVAVIMMVVAAFFTLCSVLSLVLLQRVHSIFRRTGASFQRAQEEFSQDFFANRTVRNAATSAATAAAQNSFQGN